MLKKTLKVSTIAALVVGSATTFAGINDVYVLGGFGWGGVDNVKLKNVEFDNVNLVADLKTKSDTNWLGRIGGGYNFTQHWGLEVNWFRYGNFDKSHSSDDEQQGFSLRSEITDWELSGVYNYHFDKCWSVFGRLGLAYVENQINAKQPAGSPYVLQENGDHKNGFGAGMGIGVMYKFNPWFATRLEGAGVVGETNLWNVTANAVVFFNS